MSKKENTAKRTVLDSLDDDESEIEHTKSYSPTLSKKEMKTKRNCVLDESDDESEENNKQLNQPVIVPAHEQKEILKSHEIITQSKTNNLFECSICLEIMKEPISLPCFHKYCKACIISNFDANKKRSCPICRSTVPKSFVLVVDFTIVEMISILFPK